MIVIEYLAEQKSFYYNMEYGEVGLSSPTDPSVFYLYSTAQTQYEIALVEWISKFYLTQ